MAYFAGDYDIARASLAQRGEAEQLRYERKFTVANEYIQLKLQEVMHSGNEVGYCARGEPEYHQQQEKNNARVEALLILARELPLARPIGASRDQKGEAVELRYGRIFPPGDDILKKLHEVVHSSDDVGRYAHGDNQYRDLGDKNDRAVEELLARARNLPLA
jgi:hypothetical protein